MIRHKIVERKNLVHIAESDSLESPVNELDAAALQQQLRRTIVKLPEHLMNVVLLHDLGELSYSQVAQMLGISQATARVYRCKAVELLTVWMDKGEK